VWVVQVLFRFAYQLPATLCTDTAPGNRVECCCCSGVLDFVLREAVSRSRRRPHAPDSPRGLARSPLANADRQYRLHLFPSISSFSSKSNGACPDRHSCGNVFRDTATPSLTVHCAIDFWNEGDYSID
jgi:hypothetical protein